LQSKVEVVKAKAAKGTSPTDDKLEQIKKELRIQANNSHQTTIIIPKESLYVRVHTTKTKFRSYFRLQRPDRCLIERCWAKRFLFVGHGLYARDIVVHENLVYSVEAVLQGPGCSSLQEGEGGGGKAVAELVLIFEITKRNPRLNLTQDRFR
jgi:hypothetical protein